MSKQSGVSEARFARVALGIALTACLLATVGAALAGSPAPVSGPTTVIAPVDTVGINVLEPTRVPAPQGGPVRLDRELERQALEWNATGRNGGGGGSPKG